MKQALAILKYFPAVLGGLLVVAWVVSGFYTMAVYFSLPKGIDGHGHLEIACAYGTVYYFHDREDRTDLQVFVCRNSGDLDFRRRWFGVFEIEAPPTPRHTVFRFPVIWLVTLSLPVAIGCFYRYRFPLWSWFAWTALIAIELAYYLR